MTNTEEVFIAITTTEVSMKHALETAFDATHESSITAFYLYICDIQMFRFPEKNNYEYSNVLRFDKLIEIPNSIRKIS